MGERSEAVQQECEAELDSIAARLCTALTTLRDYPAIRYRVGKPPEAGDAPGASVRSLVSQRLAQKVGGSLIGAQKGFVLAYHRSQQSAVIQPYWAFWDCMA
jgi:hypothetical protein